MKATFNGHCKVLFMDKGSHKIAPLVDQLAHACPNVLPYQASNEEEAVQLLLSLSFDLFVLNTESSGSERLKGLAIGRDVTVFGLTNGQRRSEQKRRFVPSRVTTAGSEMGAEELAGMIQGHLELLCQSRARRWAGALLQLPFKIVSCMTPKEAGIVGDPDKLFFY